MAYQPTYNPQSVIGSVFTYPQANQSVSGTVNIGTTPGSVLTFPGANQSVSGTVDIGTIPGSVLAFQASTWPGSILSFPGANQSISGTVNLGVGATVIGSVATLQGTNPWITTFSNSSILATQQGTRISSVINSTPSSLLAGASIFGMLPAGTQVIGSVAILQGTNPLLISGSITNLNGSNVIGSIAALQGTNPWLVSFANSSILATQQGTRISSIVNSIPSSVLVGNYGHRNDAVASFLGGNLTWNPQATDSAGRILSKPFVSEDSTIISYTGSLVSASVTLVRASALGLVNYITDFWVVNTGSVAQLLTFTGGDTSVVGYTTAPATGGSNSQGINIPLKATRAQDLRWQITGTSSVVYLAVKGYQAP